MFSEETVKSLIEGSKGLAELTITGGTVLMNEALNILILEACLSVLKFAVVFVAFYLVKKFVDTMMAVEEDVKTKNKLKAVKLSALIISLTFFTYKSFPHLVDAGKIMVAPHMFMIEKGYKILKPKE